MPRLLLVPLGLLLAACAVHPLTPTPVPATAVVVRITTVASSPTPAPSATRPPINTALPRPTEAATDATLGEAKDERQAAAATDAPVALAAVAPATAAVQPPAAGAGGETGTAGGAAGAAAPAAAPTAVPPVAVAPPASADVAAAEQYCVELINAERAKAGLAPLVADPALMGVARARVADMVARGYTGHYDPVTGVSMSRAMIPAAGFTSGYIGENWYGSINAPPAIVDTAMGWFMTDPPHYRNILNANYAYVGVGIAYNGRQWLLVQNFAGN